MKLVRTMVEAFPIASLWCPLALAQSAVRPAWTAESDQARASFGSSVESAGDVNGDGYGDVIVSAFSFDNGETDEGRAYVFH